ncbi:hypothetical protein BDZ85DRAFT_257873 [Elsinoe ampelina]|uniref:Uncharacterized protein n=1 Tax=Elsinoe ampelina TaxID=302913 RepID=A0A6A6GJ08_9PEZI|nr:hypothetical protein BDZ85DRAFT_257873 [Elsinoe ampelina]
MGRCDSHGPCFVHTQTPNPPCDSRVIIEEPDYPLLFHFSACSTVMASSEMATGRSSVAAPIVLENQIALKVTPRDNRKGRHTLLVLPGTVLTAEKMPDDASMLKEMEEAKQGQLTTLAESTVQQVVSSPGNTLRFDTPSSRATARRILQNIRLMFRLHQPLYDVSYLIAFLYFIGSVV